MKDLFFCYLLATVMSSMALGQGRSYEIDLRNIQPLRPPVPIDMRGKNPLGETLSVNSRYFERNGAPWFPLMGEMHYNRVRPEDWEQGILKMKSAGLSVIATYVFWNEHEIARNSWDWKGNRDLRHFIELCGKNGMYVWLRIGPWSHGEQLYGGFPAWIQAMSGKRSNDTAYLNEANRLFTQIGEQSSGLFFEDGGPVIGVQLENEYASGLAGHISELKRLALAANIHPVYWSVTANTVFDDTKSEVIPLQGSYPYRGWEPGGGEATKDFLYGSDQWIMTDVLGKVFYDVSKYPRGLCEQGVGSQMTYPNRFIVEPYVVEAHLQNQIGRGMNMIGYYMFHGGTQTPGLKEPGCPESYDFQAPIGEYGYIRPSYSYLKTLHLFINDFGSDLAQMQVIALADPVRNELDTTDLRYIARVKDNRGFIFICNSQVRVPMPDKRVKLTVVLQDEKISFPSLLIKGQTSPIIPFNLRSNGILLKYVTAQPLASVKEARRITLFFQQLPGVVPQVAIEASSIREGALKDVLWEKEGNAVIISLGKQKQVLLTGKDGKEIRLVFLSRKEALGAWKLTTGGKELLVVTDADLVQRGDQIALKQWGSPSFNFSVYPAGACAFSSASRRGIAGDRGAFDRYSFSAPAVVTPVSVQQMPAVDEVVIKVPTKLAGSLSDAMVKIDYRGASCKAFRRDSVVADHLFNGIPWLLGINKFLGKGDLRIQIQPWDDRITGVDPRQIKEIKANGLLFKKVEIIPQYQAVFNIKALPAYLMN